MSQKLEFMIFTDKFLFQKYTLGSEKAFSKPKTILVKKLRTTREKKYPTKTKILCFLKNETNFEKL